MDVGNVDFAGAKNLPQKCPVQPSSLLASLAMGSFKAFTAHVHPCSHGINTSLCVINQLKSVSLFLYSSMHRSVACCTALSRMSPCIRRCMNLASLYKDVQCSRTSSVVYGSACSGHSFKTI